MKTKLTLLMLLFPLMMAAQGITIKGTVVSEADGYPLPGVTVKVLGTNNATVTDIDGNYTLSTNSAGTLEYSFVGCKTQTRKFSGSQTIDITLADDSNMLDEVVMIGYGTMKKSDLTGSVATVNTDQMKKVPAVSIDQALQGRAAGVSVNLNSGQPGAGATVRIRGIGTVNDANPIYVVDGVITDNINFLSPNDIASMEVLKDASSTAIYGSRGANGVILVTTKTGNTKGHSEISYDGYIGWQTSTKMLDVMKSRDFLETQLSMTGVTKGRHNYYYDHTFNEYINQFITSSSENFPAVKGYNPETKKFDPDYAGGLDYGAIETDWQNEVFRSGAFMQNHHVSIDGSTDKSNYSFSGSYYDQDGTIIGSDYKRYTVRANTSFEVNKWLKIGENATYMYSTGRSVMNNNASPGASIISAALAMAPWDPTHYPDGSFTRKGKDLSGQISAASNFKNVTNPFSQIEHSHPNNVNERLVTNLYAEITPFKGLTYRADVSADFTWNRGRSYTEKYFHSEFDRMEKNGVGANIDRYSSVIWNNILTYANTIKDHNFSIMLGQTGEEYNYYGISASGNYVSGADDPNHWYVSQTDQNTRLAGDGVSRSRRFSWLGRAFYSWKDRYLFTFNFRADGTNKFPENTWGYFPSMALGWRMKEENFLKDVKWLDNLKLRFGWGRIGNDKIGNDAFNQTIANTPPTFVGYVLGPTQQLTNGATVITWKNQGGLWELTETWNAGVDFSFWRGLLSGSIEGFIRDTKDMLLTVKGPAWTGNRYDAQANVGKVRNKGIEIQLGHTNSIGEFTYSVDGNISFLSNKLTALNGGDIVRDGNGIQVSDQGYTLYTFKGYRYKGIYKTDEEAAEAMWGYGDAQQYHAGDAIYEDVSGPEGTPDGKITEEDKVDIGNPFANIVYGLNLTAQWKGIDFSMFFSGQAGNKIYNALRTRLEGTGTECILASYMKDVWHNVYDEEGNIVGQEGSIANPYNTINNAVSSRFVESGSYFRLKNIQLGYTFPRTLISHIGLSKLRVYASCSNLFTITHYSGYDPEVGGGVDYGNYPQARTFLMGLQVTF